MADESERATYEILDFIRANEAGLHQFAQVVIVDSFLLESQS